MNPCQYVHGRHGFPVLVLAHVKRLDILRIVVHDHRGVFEHLLREVPASQAPLDRMLGSS